MNEDDGYFYCLECYEQYQQEEVNKTDQNANDDKESNNQTIHDALNAADEVLGKFEEMKNNYHNLNDQLNNIIQQSQTNNNMNKNPYQYGNEIYPPPQPRNNNQDNKAEENEDDQEEEIDLGGMAAASHYCPHISTALKIPKDVKKFPKLSM